MLTSQLGNAYQDLAKELSSEKLKVIGGYTLGRVIGEGALHCCRGPCEVRSLADMTTQGRMVRSTWLHIARPVHDAPSKRSPRPSRRISLARSTITVACITLESSIYTRFSLPKRTFG